MLKVKDNGREIANLIFNIVQQAYIHISGINNTSVLYSFTNSSERYGTLCIHTKQLHHMKMSSFQDFSLVTIPHQYQELIQTLNCLQL
jgi:hypothetical protein